MGWARDMLFLGGYLSPAGLAVMAGEPVVFADGFAGFDRSATTNRAPAAYRPIGIAEGADGALYVADSQKGRIWRIAYQNGSSDRTAARPAP